MLGLQTIRFSRYIVYIKFAIRDVVKAVKSKHGRIDSKVLNAYI